MPEIGIPELLIILVIVLILFGPGRLAGVEPWGKRSASFAVV